MNRIAKVLILLIPALALTASGCGRRRADAPAEAPAAPAVPVVAQTVTPADFDLTVGVTGGTESLHEVDFAARVAGTVESFDKLTGDAVAAGELICLIDPRRYDAQVAQAEAGLKSAEAMLRNAGRELDRATELKRRERISDAEYDGIDLAHSQAESGWLAAQATLTQARLQREDCEIRAPFAGRLTSRGVEVGELVAPGAPLTGVIDLTAILIRGSLSETNAVRVREGMEVDVRIPALRDRLFAGRVRSLGVRSDPATRTFPVEILVDNPGGEILSGMAASCGIHVDREGGVITAPVSAIVDQYGQAFVYVVENGRAARRRVELGERSGDVFIVDGGLSAGDKLIVKGQFSVRDGMRVDLKNPSDLD